jgi:hypothetical protein
MEQLSPTTQTQQASGSATSQPSVQQQAQQSTGLEGWADEQIISALQQNGISSIHDLNNYALALEERAQTVESDTQQILDYLINANDPNAVLEFVNELRSQVGGEGQQQEQQPQQKQVEQPQDYERPVMNAPGDQYYGQPAQQTFSGMLPGEIASIQANIYSPDQQARWDEAVLNTPMAAWQQLAPYLIQGN